MKKVEAYEADDGRVFKHYEEAARADMEKALYDAFGIDVAELIMNNLEQVKWIINQSNCPIVTELSAIERSL